MLHSEQPCDLYMYQSIGKSVKIEWDFNVAWMRRKEIHTELWWQILLESVHLEN
jgi:hypothetical protein